MRAARNSIVARSAGGISSKTDRYFQPLLVANAEMLLLVDDQQAEVPELDRFAEQRMGADHNVDTACSTIVTSEFDGGFRRALGVRHQNNVAATRRDLLHVGNGLRANACAARFAPRSIRRHAGPGTIIRRRAASRMVRPMPPYVGSWRKRLRITSDESGIARSRTRRPERRAVSAQRCPMNLYAPPHICRDRFRRSAGRFCGRRQVAWDGSHPDYRSRSAEIDIVVVIQPAWSKTDRGDGQ